MTLRAAPTDTTKINVDGLRQLARRNELARLVFAVLSERRRADVTTDVRRLRFEIRDERNFNSTDREMLEVFREVAKFSGGRVKLPRKPKDPLRFEWGADSITVARVALGHVENGGRVAAELDTGPAPGTVRVVFPMRGQMINLDLPQDMTRGEAQELGEFIKRFGK